MAATGAVAVGWGSRSAFAADAEIVLTPGQPGPAISPHIYGHFIEHLGGVISSPARLRSAIGGSW
jgi:alpha-N-arabinofuranosidase